MTEPTIRDFAACSRCGAYFVRMPLGWTYYTPPMAKEETCEPHELPGRFYRLGDRIEVRVEALRYGVSS